MHKFDAQNNLSGLFSWSCLNVLEHRATTYICISCNSVQFKIPKVNDGALFFLFARISYNVSSRQSEKYIGHQTHEILIDFSEGKHNRCEIIFVNSSYNIYISMFVCIEVIPHSL